MRGTQLLGRWALAAAMLSGGGARACPFCVATGPTFAERREEAAVAALGELRPDPAPGRVGFAPLRVERGSVAAADGAAWSLPAVGLGVDSGLAVVLGTLPDDAPVAEGPLDPSRARWEILPVGEAAFAYLGRVPAPRGDRSARLREFVACLEHPDPLVAEDAYQEFARADYHDVAAMADAFDSARLRGWLESPAVRDERKGFYALALGLCPDPAERPANLALLRRLVEAPADDFRAGYAGLWGGLLVAEGEEALTRMEDRLLRPAMARVGDVRHAMTALRFAHEYHRAIPPERLAAAMGLLLARPEFAAEAIVDLRRWQAWHLDAEVAAVVERPAEVDPTTLRAAAGFLLLCPTDMAREALERLRTAVPERVAEAERQLALFAEPSAR